MVKLSLWDKEKSPAEGTSFTPTFSSSSKRPRTAPAAPSSSSLPSLLRLGSDAPPQPELPPIITLKLSSPSFLDSVVHDGLSDNPLYVMETQDNTTKVRRSDPKGFINVARVRWRQDAKSSRKSRELVGIQVAFGKGQWKPAEEFLGYSYGSLLKCVVSTPVLLIYIQSCFCPQLSQVLSPPPPPQHAMETNPIHILRESFIVPSPGPSAHSALPVHDCERKRSSSDPRASYSHGPSSVEGLRPPPPARCYASSKDSRRGTPQPP